MTPRELVGRMGRDALLAEIDRLEKLNAQLNDNLTSVQARCTELVLELREARKAVSDCLFVIVDEAGQVPS